MISKETRSSAMERLNKLSDELRSRYEVVVVNGEKRFHTKKDKFFSAMLFCEWNAILLEYAVGIQAAELNQFDDGARFYLDEMDDDALLAAVLREIEE